METSTKESSDFAADLKKQIMSQMTHAKDFIETQSKDHPALFFAGAFAVGILAAKPGVLRFLTRAAFGLASMGLGVDSDFGKTVANSMKPKERDTAPQQSSVDLGSDDSQMTHH